MYAQNKGYLNVHTKENETTTVDFGQMDLRFTTLTNNNNTVSNCYYL